MYNWDNAIFSHIRIYFFVCRKIFKLNNEKTIAKISYETYEKINNELIMVLGTQVFDAKEDVTEMLYSIFKAYDVGCNTSIRRIINFSEDTNIQNVSQFLQQASEHREVLINLEISSLKKYLGISTLLKEYEGGYIIYNEKLTICYNCKDNEAQLRSTKNTKSYVLFLINNKVFVWKEKKNDGYKKISYSLSTKFVSRDIEFPLFIILKQVWTRGIINQISFKEFQFLCDFTNIKLDYFSVESKEEFLHLICPKQHKVSKKILKMPFMTAIIFLEYLKKIRTEQYDLFFTFLQNWCDYNIVEFLYKKNVEFDKYTKKMYDNENSGSSYYNIKDLIYLHYFLRKYKIFIYDENGNFYEENAPEIRVICDYANQERVRRSGSINLQLKTYKALNREHIKLTDIITLKNKPKTLKIREDFKKIKIKNLSLIRKTLDLYNHAKKMKNCVFTRLYNIQQGKSAVYELTYDKLPYTVELRLKKGKPFLYEIGATMNENTEKLHEAKNYLQTELKKHEKI
ncbi:hypothetical protein CAPN002_00190 [Capnocytophaga stomatis]|uniref:hypothetical protein n=1 Tax=Capnocytophaga stomatis TaxID=1848904 RepID=UPI001952415F|nr:hypothetical protein [Capnocytophaga stomatis]GIJ92801.1 hypothetical protein CAPN002_00190 [Capnocytophaga stomatis]